MFGPLGLPELIFIFVLALLVFGPRKLPELGKTVGKALGEFRRATADLKSSFDTEMDLEERRQRPPREPEPRPRPTPREVVAPEPTAESATSAESPAPTASPAPHPTAPTDPGAPITDRPASGTSFSAARGSLAPAPPSSDEPVKPS